MAYRRVARKIFYVVLAKNVADKANVFFYLDFVSVVDSDSGGFLSAVLQGVKAKVASRGGIKVFGKLSVLALDYLNAVNAAFVMQLVVKVLLHLNHSSMSLAAFASSANFFLKAKSFSLSSGYFIERI